MKYPLARSTWGEEEKEAIREVVETGRLTMGEKVKEFERRFAKYHNVKYAVMVNSGSSANLLGATALRYTDKFDARDNDEIIVPAIGWSTTFFPFHQAGFNIVFVDIFDNLCISLNEAKKRISRRTKAICAVNTLGFSVNIPELENLCKQHDLLYIEDNCEGLGAWNHGLHCGTRGLYSTFSFFFSHHIQTIEGGMLITNDEDLYHTALSLRSHGWIRDLPNKNRHYNKAGNDFEESWKFILPGYNIRPTEINGVLGICQLEKLDKFLGQRRKNAEIYKKLFKGEDYCRIYNPDRGASWFHFPFVLEGKLRGKRQLVVDYFREHLIDTRPIISGNFVRNPVVNKMKCSWSINLDNAEEVDRHGLMIGNSHVDLEEELGYARDIFREIARQRR